MYELWEFGLGELYFLMCDVDVFVGVSVCDDVFGVFLLMW